jgi:hypothetical protein
LRHTLHAGGRVSPGVLPTRIALAAVLAVTVLAAALAVPGVHFKGQGRLPATVLPGKTARSTTQDAQAHGSRKAPQPKRNDDPGTAGEAAATLVSAMSGLGRLLRIPLLVAVALLVLLALSRLRPSLPRWRDLLARLRAWLSGLVPKRAPRPAPVEDPFAALGALAALPPRDAVLAVYRRLLLVLEQAGHPRPERATPDEHLSAFPARLKPVAAPARALTDLYVLAAYGDGEPTTADRDRALAALGEMRAAAA